MFIHEPARRFNCLGHVLPAEGGQAGYTKAKA